MGIILIEELFKLYQNELYSNAKELSQLILTIYTANRSTLQIEENFLVLIVLADSCFEEKCYREAQENYQKALIVRKQLPKKLSINDKDKISLIEKNTDLEIQYRIAKCLLESKQVNEAVQLLREVPSKQRTPKINMLLSKILHESGNERSAVGGYKEVLKEFPLALEAIEGLLNLHVKGSEVNSLVFNASQACGDWLNNWIKALSQMEDRKFTDAVTTLKTIESTSNLKNYPKLLILIAESYYYNGDYELACSYFKRAHSLYPHMSRGIEKYAMLLFQLHKRQDLELLIKPASLVPYENSSEMWFIMSQYLLFVQKPDKAIYILEKVFQQNKRNVDALLLKSRILHQMKKHNEALMTLRQALKYQNYRYETHKGIIESLVGQEKFKEAQQQAYRSLKALGETPRTLTLTATTYLKDPALVTRAKTLLVKALEMNDMYVKAIVILAQVYIDENETNAAIKLLEKSTSSVAHIRIILMLADLYAKKGNQSGAMEQYTKALNLDANNRLALHGLMSLGASTGSNNNNSSTAILDASSTSEEVSDLQDNALEMVHNEISQAFKVNNDSESESELAWSDVEMEAETT